MGCECIYTFVEECYFVVHCDPVFQHFSEVLVRGALMSRNRNELFQVGNEVSKTSYKDRLPFESFAPVKLSRQVFRVIRIEPVYC